MLLKEVLSQPKAPKPHPTLSIGWKRGPNSSNLAGHEQTNDTPEYDSVQLFEVALWDARNKWSIQRRSSGMFAVGRLSKADADKFLKAALTTLAEGGGL